MNENQNDPLGLGVNLNEVDTSFPVLQEGTYPFTVAEMEIVPKSDDPNKRNLKVKFALDEDGESTKGGKLSKGYPIITYYPLQKSDNPDADPEGYKKRLALLVDAVFQTDDDSRPSQFPEFSEFIGRPVMGVIKVTEDDQYGTSNNLARLISAV